MLYMEGAWKACMSVPVLLVLACCCDARGLAQARRGLADAAAAGMAAGGPDSGRPAEFPVNVRGFGGPASAEGPGAEAPAPPPYDDYVEVTIVEAPVATAPALVLTDEMAGTTGSPMRTLQLNATCTCSGGLVKTATLLLLKFCSTCVAAV